MKKLILAILLIGLTSFADEPCSKKNYNYTVIEKACREGGRHQVKEIMKAAVKRAKAAGEDMKCTSCHQDMKTFNLKDNAVSDLKKWL